MLNPELDPAPEGVRIHRIGYISRCKARRCLARATAVAKKANVVGLDKSSCAPLHCEAVMEISDRRGVTSSAGDRAPVRPALSF